MGKRVLIVGAGPGAGHRDPASAGRLAGAAPRTSATRGRTHPRSRRISLDLGPTFFLYPRILAEIYAAAGYDLHQEIALVRLDPQYRLVFGAGGELHATPVLERMEHAIARLAPQDAPSLRRFLADNRTKLERFQPCLETPFLGWRDICTARMLRLLPLLRPWRSLDRELRTYFQDPRVRLAFAFQAKYLGMSPLQCPSLFSILSFLEYAYGVYHPPRLWRRHREYGACRCWPRRRYPPQRARHLAALPRTARRGGTNCARCVPCRRCGAQCRLCPSHDHLVPDTLRRRWTDRKIARNACRVRPLCSTWRAGAYPDLPHHTIYLARDYLTNLDDIERRHVLSTDPSFYVQNACVTDPTLAPPA